MSQIEVNPDILSQSANKTVLITGAARGIGAAAAALFNHHGANVVIADLAQFQQTAEHLIVSTFTNPQRAIFVPGNIVDWTQLTSCFKAAVERFGGLDVVVANAGIMESSPVLVMDVDENGDLKEHTDAERVIDVNLKGTLNSMLSFLSFHCLFPKLQTGMTCWLILTKHFWDSTSTRALLHETTEQRDVDTF
jgi:NAD(P)-dependent dehydrogenase (short-subunit alcohol dehydrogenase family)